MTARGNETEGERQTLLESELLPADEKGRDTVHRELLPAGEKGGRLSGWKSCV